MGVFTFSCGESINLAVFLKSSHILPVDVQIREEDLDNPNDGPSMVTKHGYQAWLPTVDIPHPSGINHRTGEEADSGV